ncbi:MAG: cell division protein FtsL [Acetatifactor sp.]
MSQNRRNYGQATYDKSRNVRSGRNRSEYVYGNTVRKIAPAVPFEDVPERHPAPAVRKNREKARRMSFGYVLFLAAAMCTAAFVLIHYIQLQGELTQKTKSVAAKEVQLNNLKVANDEEYNRITSSIDLEEIKRVAIGELGMIYAQEGQIVTYTNEKNDYMRQVGQN